MRRLESLSRDSGLFSVPSVSSVGKDDGGRVYYEMEFVVGQTLESMIEDMLPSEISDYAQHLHKIHSYFANQKPLDNAKPTNEWEFLLGKLYDIRFFLDTMTHPLLPNAELVTNYKNLVEELSSTTPTWETNLTFCHGDFALDNLLISRDREVYLIDPLINDFESVWWDRAKVLQSSLIQWGKIKRGEVSVEAESGAVFVQGVGKMYEFNLAYLAANQDIAESEPLTLYLAVTLTRIVRHAKSSLQMEALLALTNRLLRQYLRKEEIRHESIITVRR